MPMNEITVDDLQECLDDCPHGKRTRQNMKAVCGLVYKYGIPRKVIPENLNLAQFLIVEGEAAARRSSFTDAEIEAEIKDERLGYVGEITNINIAPIKDLLDNGYIPVVSTVGCDRKGNIYNINGDTAAAHIAGALGAERLIMMTDIAGILRDKDDPTTLIREMTVEQAKGLYDEGVISGGMIPKVDCCIEALDHGVKNVVIMDGRIPHSILMELLTDEGAGTMVTKG